MQRSHGTNLEPIHRSGRMVGTAFTVRTRPGEINVVVSVAGMVVRPGDLIAGAHDGVVAIPAEEAERVIAAAEAQNRKEQAALAAIEAGTWDRSWVDGALEARGCDPAG